MITESLARAKVDGGRITVFQPGAWDLNREAPHQFLLFDRGLGVKLPDVVMHEQTGCAHFSPLVVAICFLLQPHPEFPNGMFRGLSSIDTLRCFGSHPKKNQSVGVECRRTLSYKEQFTSSCSAIV